MSEYGLKIKNIEAATLYEHNIGIRDHYDYKDAMFVNSLFKDFLDENGLESDGDSTRDIICIEFNFGTRTYAEERAHLKKIAQKARTEHKIEKSFGVEAKIEKTQKKREKIADLFQEAERKKDLYKKVSKEEIRRIFYNEGVNVQYRMKTKDGHYKNGYIHYKMLYRSTGKAKKGSCMFICDRLYEKARDFLYMGLELPAENAPIVEMSAYAPLVSSGIVGRVKINPRNILIVEDVDRFFQTNILSIETDADRHCHAYPKEGYSLKNTMFDGQALIDESLFPDWGDGYILLRHHMCKMAAFNTKIQKFFQDYFGDEYETAVVKDMWGNEHLARDIELITTDNAVKYLKFGVSYDYWCQKVEENGCNFGIVKTAHESKLGSVQQMSYQMINSLTEDIMSEVVAKSVEYVWDLKQNDNMFLEFLRKNINFSNDYEALVGICEHNPEFMRSDYFRARKKDIIKIYLRSVKAGKILQNADNLVIVGSPYAMLLHAVGASVDEDPTFQVEDNAIQCYTARFGNGEYLAEFRSPFNSASNLGYLHNTYHPYYTQYFNFGRQIIAINMNGTDFQDRNNGLTYWPRSAVMC